MAIRGLLLDLEGVLHEGGTPIPGAVGAVAEIERLGLPIRYLTNTTTKPRHLVAGGLRRLGFPVEDGHLFTPTAAACLLLSSRGTKRIHLAAEPSLEADFGSFDLVGAQDEGCEAVVLGDLYLDFTWQRLNDLFRGLLRGAELVALHKNRVCRRAGELSLDLGPFVAALEYACATEASVVGKPSPAFFALALESLQLPAGEVLMVGDDIEADIAGAQASGLRAAQVRTGKFRAQDESHPTAHPAARLDSIVDLAPWLEAQS